MRHLPQQAAFSIVGAVLLLSLVILLGPLPAAQPAVRSSSAPAPTPLVPGAAVSPTTAATAPPAATATTNASSNDPSAMLRAHNALRASVGAPAVRPDERVSAAAQRHAEYLARNAAGGHDETPGLPGFTVGKDRHGFLLCT